MAVEMDKILSFSEWKMWNRASGKEVSIWEYKKYKTQAAREARIKRLESCVALLQIETVALQSRCTELENFIFEILTNPSTRAWDFETYAKLVRDKQPERLEKLKSHRESAR